MRQDILFIESKKFPEIIGTVPERENNCLHVDVKEVTA